MKNITRICDAVSFKQLQSPFYRTHSKKQTTITKSLVQKDYKITCDKLKNIYSKTFSFSCCSFLDICFDFLFFVIFRILSIFIERVHICEQKSENNANLFFVVDFLLLTATAKGTRLINKTKIEKL